jgi:hypothetical protein
MFVVSDAVPGTPRVTGFHGLAGPGVEGILPHLNLSKFKQRSVFMDEEP